MSTVSADIKWSRISKSPILAAAFTGIYVSTFYIMGNITMLPAMSVLVILLVLTLPITILVAFSTVLLRRINRDAYIGIVSVFICALYLLVLLRTPIFHMRSVIAFRSQFEGIAWILMHLGIFLIPAGILAYVFHRNLGKYTAVLTVMSLSAVLLGVATTAETNTRWRADHMGKTGTDLQSITLIQKPNIYLILADGFGSFAYMREANIDVSTFRKSLLDMNFRLYDEIFSNYHPTNPAMLAMLNLEHHYYSSTVKGHELNKIGREIVGGENNLVRLLRGNGYEIEYIHQGNYLLLQGCTADFCYPKPTSTLGAQYILREILPSFVKIKRREPEWQVESREKFQTRIVDLVKSGMREQYPRFRYIHLYEPGHAPNDVMGTCNESKQLEAYSRAIKWTSDYLPTLVKDISMYDPNALIVVAGDHGPFITRQCRRKIDLRTAAEYRDRTGSLLAIRWRDDYHGLYDMRIKTNVNLFRYILASLADTDTTILSTVVPDNVYIQGSHDILQILTDGNIMIPPKAIDGNKSREEKLGEPIGNLE